MKLLVVLLLALCALMESVDNLISKSNLSLNAIKDVIIKWIKDLEDKVKSLVNQLKELIEALKSKIAALRDQIKTKIQQLKEDFKKLVEEMEKHNEKVSICAEAQSENFKQIFKDLDDSEEVCLDNSKEKVDLLHNLISDDVEDINAVIKQITEIVEICLQEELLSQISCLYSKVGDIAELAEITVGKQIAAIKKLYSGLEEIRRGYWECAERAHSDAVLRINDLVTEIKKCAEEP